MNFRKLFEEYEDLHLSKYATRSINSKGRKTDEDNCDFRTIYQRDRDRIIYCKAFRRLKHKTQVFISPEGDHYRTRLTHTLEVSQIARTIARCLFLNEDLTEAIALGHDLGHTPFGHAGERVLSELTNGKFKHNEQSVRVVEKLEKNGKGLNLSYEVVDGIKTHTGNIESISKEGKIVKIADRIAYINHDIDDAIRGGIIEETTLPDACRNVLGESCSIRINNMISNIIENSKNTNDILMSNEFYEASNELRTYMFSNVYIDSLAKSEEKKAEALIEKLYSYYKKNIQDLPPTYIRIANSEGEERAVVDFIAGMTDRYALKDFERLYFPSNWKY